MNELFNKLNHHFSLGESLQDFHIFGKLQNLSETRLASDLKLLRQFGIIQKSL